jgi:hypothetical protein
MFFGFTVKIMANECSFLLCKMVQLIPRFLVYQKRILRFVTDVQKHRGILQHKHKDALVATVFNLETNFPPMHNC